MTKQEIYERKETEIKLGSKDISKLKPPVFVKNDLVAFNHWKQCIKEYKEAAKAGAEVLSTSDVGMLALYCKTFADYERLLKSYQSIDKIVYDSNALDDYIEDAEEFNEKIKKQLRSMIAVDGLLRIETAINKKMDMLLKMQDRLFLNPLAKIKNVPKPRKEKPSNPMERAGFNL
ncbi:P27 family phage terminase small subunit [Sporomusa sphaeroides DSM 2875]|uniref:P27 family phage terminase small subunit n=1 Tax=Sporomusa sphaeroides TaxID=47679 RepID=UPI00202ECA7C|nr:P27 family phage terminase small subunit [Sporomusa sphaeroides]MCM0760677.1 P27 family phage terminase small subunit [Sporomusa sphaeroides DSM 2875]